MPPRDQEQHAIAALQAAPQQAIFAGARLEGQSLRIARWTREMKSRTGAVKQAAKAPISAAEDRIIAEVRRQLMDQICQLFDVQVLLDIASIIEQTVFEQAINVIAEVTPYLGLAKNGVVASKSMMTVALRIVAGYRVALQRDHVKEGEGDAALSALLTLIKREIAFNTSKSSRELVALAAKAGGSAADFGSGVTHIAVGILNAVAALIETITAMALEFADARAGNKALDGPIDARIFAKAPILACYYLTCASVSDIIAFAAGDIVTGNSFTTRIEALRKQIDVVQWNAAHAIQTSRFVLVRDGVEVVPSARAVGLASPKVTTAKSLDQSWLDKGTGHAGQHVPDSMKVRGGLPGLFGADSGQGPMTLKKYGAQVAKGFGSKTATELKRYQHNFTQMVSACLPGPV